MVLKRLKLPQIFNVVARNFSYTQAWVLEVGDKFENFSKKAVFLVSSGKNKFHHCWPPNSTKTFGKIH